LFENWVLRRIFGPRKEEVGGGRGRLHNEKPPDLYALTYVIRVIKSRRIRWAAHVTCMLQMRSAYKILVRKPRRRDHS
jgi:hypothetical protein